MGTHENEIHLLHQKNQRLPRQKLCGMTVTVHLINAKSIGKNDFRSDPNEH